MKEKEVEGKYDQVKGDVKQEVGDLTGNDNLKAEGTWDKVKGGVKEGVGKVQDALDNDK